MQTKRTPNVDNTLDGMEAHAAFKALALEPGSERLVIVREDLKDLRELRPLLSAAPDLLAFVQAFLDGATTETLVPQAKALVARLEPKPCGECQGTGRATKHSDSYPCPRCAAR